MPLQYPTLPPLCPATLCTMFEEDSHRCYICQAPCNHGNLFCSAECRMKDNGSEAPKKTSPIAVTSQIPFALSPLIRPHHSIQPSPKMPPHGHTDSSSSSSITSSPLQSPSSVPADNNSPNKDLIALPPPAFPSSAQTPGSIPVKIPSYVPKPAAPAVTSTSHGIGSSIGTLRFGRKPSIVNAVTSPNAWGARCACGKPANHRSRPSSLERQKNNTEIEFAKLSLGPSVTSSPRDRRIISEGSVRKSNSGYTTPNAIGASLLSRSKSDSSSPNMLPNYLNKEMIKQTRRSSNAAALMDIGRPCSSSPGIKGSPTISSSYHHQQPQPCTPEGGGVLGDFGRSGRGRSKERIKYAFETTPNGFNHPPEREAAPSKSRNRREEKERELKRLQKSQLADREDREKEGLRVGGGTSSPISPSWTKNKDEGVEIVPSLMREKSGRGRTSPRTQNAL